jgi:hypothetical protein
MYFDWYDEPDCIITPLTTSARMYCKEQFIKYFIDKGISREKEDKLCVDADKMRGGIRPNVF